MENTRHFTLIIAGNNPEEMIKKYDRKIEVEPYLVLEFSKAKEYHNKYVKYYEEALKVDGLDEFQKETINNLLNIYKSESDEDFYLDITEEFDLDPNTGDAYSKVNKNGKYDSCHIGKDLSMPLINKMGEETFSEIKSNIDWDKINGNNKHTYEIVWDMCVDGVKPSNKEEEKLYENMKNRNAYFETFGTKENYVESNTAFWGYAFLSENGWKELGSEYNQFEWVKNFYCTFIKNLPDDTLISVYECIRY